MLPLQLAALRCAGKEVEKLIEVGTLLTSNHGHAAMFGVFGILALAVLVFCLRSMQTDAVWQGTVRYIRIGFWGLNAGLALMVITDLFPAGVLQLWDSLSQDTGTCAVSPT